MLGLVRMMMHNITMAACKEKREQSVSAVARAGKQPSENQPGATGAAALPANPTAS